MQVSVYDLKGNAKGKTEVPAKLLADKRKDLIKKAVLAEKSRKRQAYGADPVAGMRSSAYYHGRRSKRNSMMNREIARMPRIINMGFLNFRARNVPQAVKGRKAHPPKAEKVWTLKINKKEWISALYSAISFSFDKDSVSLRGHAVSGLKDYPLVVDDSFNELKKTKDVLDALNALGLSEELKRCSEKKVRGTKGKMRGRKYKSRKGPVIIVSEKADVKKAAKNLAGVDIVCAGELNVDDFAPGTNPGRMALWTKSALEAFAVKKEAAKKTEEKKTKTAAKKEVKKEKKSPVKKKEKTKG